MRRSIASTVAVMLLFQLAAIAGLGSRNNDVHGGNSDSH
jgi:hypothetical protein